MCFQCLYLNSQVWILICLQKGSIISISKIETLFSVKLQVLPSGLHLNQFSVSVHSLHAPRGVGKQELAPLFVQESKVAREDRGKEGGKKFCFKFKNLCLNIRDLYANRMFLYFSCVLHFAYSLLNMLSVKHFTLNILKISSSADFQFFVFFFPLVLSWTLKLLNFHLFSLGPYFPRTSLSRCPNVPEA